MVPAGLVSPGIPFILLPLSKTDPQHPFDLSLRHVLIVSSVLSFYQMDYNGEPEETDLETMELIIQMQLLDLDDLKEHEPEKKTDGESTDTDFAIQLMEDDLNTIRQTLADRRMVNSISGAVRENQQMITMMQEQENVAHQDRTLAIRLADSVQHQNTNAQERQVHEESLSSPDRSRSPQSLQTSPTRNPSNEDDQIEENEPESSSWAAERNKHNTRTRKVCVACTQSKPYFDVIAATCQHEYCRDCLQELFRASFTDESLFPPRCCRQDVALDQVSVLLNNELISEFERKRIEFGTTNRTYCAQATCSAFIPPAAINIHIGTCPECSSQTCTTCKLLAHHDMECPNDPALQALNELAQQSGWQKCPSCYRLVELDIGCNHMTYELIFRNFLCIKC